jgi:hypothetical protein
MINLEKAKKDALMEQVIGEIQVSQHDMVSEDSKSSRKSRK